MDGPHGGLVVIVLAEATQLLLQLRGKIRALPPLTLHVVHHLLQFKFRLGDGSQGALDVLAEDDLLPIEFIDEVGELAAEMRKVAESVIAILVVLRLMTRGKTAKATLTISMPDMMVRAWRGPRVDEVDEAISQTKRTPETTALEFPGTHNQRPSRMDVQYRNWKSSGGLGGNMSPSVPMKTYFLLRTRHRPAAQCPRMRVDVTHWPGSQSTWLYTRLWH